MCDSFQLEERVLDDGVAIRPERLSYAVNLDSLES
jgi:hypothetical protein